MSERVSPGAAGQWLGVSGSDIRRAGYFGGYAGRVAAAGKRARVRRAAVLARAAFLNAPGELES